MRIGEALGLQWDDIEFNAGFITVQRNFSKGRIGSPKNGTSRILGMSRQLADTLFRLKAERAVIRHSYATIRLSKGDTIIDIANQLGDDPTVVLKVHSHWMPGKKKAEINALDDPEYIEGCPDVERQANSRQNFFAPIRTQDKKRIQAKMLKSLSALVELRGIEPLTS